MHSFNVALSIAIVLSPVLSQAKSDCKIPIEELDTFQPLLLKRCKKCSPTEKFHLPNTLGIVAIPNRGELIIDCPEKNVTINGNVLGISSVTAKCKKGILSAYKEEISSFGCTGRIKPSARYTGNPCMENYDEVEIGFKATIGFIPTITACFDKKNENTIFTRHILHHNIEGRQRNYPRIKFIPSIFYEHNMKKLYKRSSQRRSINKLVGLNSNSVKYIKNVGRNFLAKGHYAPKADFIYGSQQHASFFYVNTAPQWQTFNAGNWLRVERSLRYYAHNRKADLLIYTGTYNVTTLPHGETEEKVDLYLYNNRNLHTVPVPKFYWKIVVDPIKFAGVAFVGLNNPYNEIKDEDILCPDVCSRLKWIKWKHEHDVDAGYTYCCTIESFTNVVNTAPKMKVSKLLK